jgi:DNA repair protein RadA/Sms
VLVEVQALSAPSGYGTPQRVATGIDQKRLAVMLAVLERRAGMSFAQLDVFVQVSAGFRLSEPAADLAVSAALISSLKQEPTPVDGLFLGEVGLGGEVRAVGGLERRLAEASRLGFRRCFTSNKTQGSTATLELVPVESVGDLVRSLAV